MGHTFTLLLVFAKDDKRAYRLGKDVYDQLCKKECLWHHHMMGTKYDQGPGIYDEYPKVILFDSAEGQKLINRTLKYMKLEFVKYANQLKLLLKQSKVELLWISGGKEVDVHCDECHQNHKEYMNIFSLCESISQSDKFVDDIYIHNWGKITNGYEYKSFIEEYTAAKQYKLTDYNKYLFDMVNQGKKLYIIPAYTKT
jgi:hypothetical protein